MGKFTKAIAATITGIIAIINQTTGLGIEIDPEKINAVLFVITPLLVYFLPNAKD